MWAEDADKDESSEEEETESDESSEDEDAAAAAAKEEASRADRKAEKKARKDAAIAKAKGKTVEVGDLPSSEEEESEDEDMPANPNHSKAARNQAKAPRNDVEEITEGVSKMAAPQSRREREALEAVAAKERYMRLQAQGKTDEAKADLARLKVIREQRAAEAARKQVTSLFCLIDAACANIFARLRRRKRMRKTMLVERRLRQGRLSCVLMPWELLQRKVRRNERLEEVWSLVCGAGFGDRLGHERNKVLLQHT